MYGGILCVFAVCHHLFLEIVIQERIKCLRLKHVERLQSGLKKQDVLDSVRVVLNQHNPGCRAFPPVMDYESPIVSKKILRIVLSYIDYVNRVVWRKD